MKFLFPALRLCSISRAKCTHVCSAHRVFWLIYLAGAQTDPVSPGRGGYFLALPSPLGTGVLDVAFEGGFGPAEPAVVGETPPGVVS